MERDPTTRVQNLDEAVCISHSSWEIYKFFYFYLWVNSKAGWNLVWQPFLENENPKIKPVVLCLKTVYITSCQWRREWINIYIWCENFICKNSDYHSSIDGREMWFRTLYVKIATIIAQLRQRDVISNLFTNHPVPSIGDRWSKQFDEKQMK